MTKGVDPVTRTLSNVRTSNRLPQMKHLPIEPAHLLTHFKVAVSTVDRSAVHGKFR